MDLPNVPDERLDDVEISFTTKATLCVIGVLTDKCSCI